MTALLFERSGRDRVIAGVCGGIAARLGVDATLVRLVFALLALAGGAGVLLYFAFWVYGGFGIAAAFIVMRFIPETRGVDSDMLAALGRREEVAAAAR